jgi:general secretion pathway protein L
MTESVGGRVAEKAIAALDWWLRGLWMGLPAWLRGRLFEARLGLTIRVRDREATIETATSAESGPRAAYVLSLDDPAARAKLVEHLTQPTSDADVVLILSRSEVLTKTLTLPLAAERELRGVLYHELDRSIPVALEEFAYDYFITGRDRAAVKLTVTVALIRRTTLDSRIGSLRALDIAPQTVTTESDDGVPMPLNLLATRLRLRLPFSGWPFDLRKTAACALAVLFVLYLPLARYHVLLTAYAKEADARRQEAVAVRADIDKERALLEGEDYLEQRRRAYVPPLAVLAELSTRLPDDTWLAHLSVTQDEVELQGETAAASSVLELIETSDLLEHAEFQTPVSQDGATGKEQFSIVANIHGAGT